MKIINQTKDTVLANRTIMANHFAARLRGLLFRPLWESYQALYLTPCHSIHTFGIRQAIDVVYLNQTGMILKWETVEPGKIRLAPKTTRGILELPQHTCRYTQCEAQDRLIQIPMRGW